MGPVLEHIDPGTEPLSLTTALPGDSSVTVFQSSSLVCITTVNCLLHLHAQALHRPRPGSIFEIVNKEISSHSPVESNILCPGLLQLIKNCQHHRALLAGALAMKGNVKLRPQRASVDEGYSAQY